MMVAPWFWLREVTGGTLEFQHWFFVRIHRRQAAEAQLNHPVRALGVGSTPRAVATHRLLDWSGKIKKDILRGECTLIFVCMICTLFRALHILHDHLHE